MGWGKQERRNNLGSEGPGILEVFGKFEPDSRVQKVERCSAMQHFFQVLGMFERERHPKKSIKTTNKSRKEGRKQRRKEGRKHGRTEGGREGRKEGMKEGTKEGRKMLLKVLGKPPRFRRRFTVRFVLDVHEQVPQK